MNQRDQYKKVNTIFSSGGQGRLGEKHSKKKKKHYEDLDLECVEWSKDPVSEHSFQPAGLVWGDGREEWPW